MNFKKAFSFTLCLSLSFSLSAVQYVDPQEHAQELPSVEKITVVINFPFTSTVQGASFHKKKSAHINRELPLLAGLTAGGGLMFAGKKILFSTGATVGDYLWYRASRCEGESYQRWYDGIYTLYKDAHECVITRKRVSWFNTLVAFTGMYLCYRLSKKAYEYAYATCNRDTEDTSY